MDCRLPGSSVHGISQATILEWVAISFSRGSSRPRNRIQVSLIVDRCFTIWATREALNYEDIKTNTNRPVTTTKETESIINLSNKEKSKTLWCYWWILQTFKEPMSIILKPFQKTEEMGTLPNSFYEFVINEYVTIALTSKPNKDTARKENYRLISLM